MNVPLFAAGVATAVVAAAVGVALFVAVAVALAAGVAFFVATGLAVFVALAVATAFVEDDDDEADADELVPVEPIAEPPAIFIEPLEVS